MQGGNMPYRPAVPVACVDTTPVLRHIGS